MVQWVAVVKVPGGSDVVLVQQRRQLFILREAVVAALLLDHGPQEVNACHVKPLGQVAN